MRKEELDSLIQKYIIAESSLEEEHAIKSMLTEEKSHGDYKDIHALFGYFDIQKSRTTPAFINPSVSAQAKEAPRVIPIRWIAVAASVIILFGAFFWLNQSPGTNSEDTFSDPYVAAESAIQALEMLGTEINRGQNIAMDQMREFDNFNKLLDIFQE
ncbi:MAG TPA: hypothetical protein VKZ56_03480 [Membranihabitans sp.]|nr:hypothetical protein [Membranihabitans sp.]